MKLAGVLDFGLASGIISLLTLLYIKRRKNKMKKSILRYEKIRSALGE